MSERTQSGAPCCAKVHNTPNPSAAQYQTCGGCPVAQLQLAAMQPKKDDNAPKKRGFV